jgi:hypothetical protein
MSDGALALQHLQRGADDLEWRHPDLTHDEFVPSGAESCRPVPDHDTT